MKHVPRGLSVSLAIVALLSAFHLCGVVLAQDTPDPRAGRVDALFEDINRAPSPGLAVAVVRDGKVILRRGYGLASIEHRAPITPSTVFDTASVAKQFTGLAVAMLVSEGKIKLGDDIRTYIPELPNLGRRITVDHLLHHTSGVRDWPGALLVGGWKFDDAITFNQILTMAYNQRELNFEPGAEHLYSNTGYNLLAEMVRRVTGRPFREWTEDRLFRPLGMNNTHFRDQYTEVIHNRAFGYARGSDANYHQMPDNLIALGSSSLFSTVDDLARWLINFDEADVGGRAAISLARTRGTLNDGKTIDYAFGLIHGKHRGLPIIYHDGAWAAFGSMLVYFPEQRFGIVILTNGSSVSAGDAAIKVTEIYLEKELDPADSAQPAKPAPAVAVPPAVIGNYVGLYRLGPGSYVRIRSEGAALMSEATREKPVTLAAMSEHEFQAGRDKVKLVFQRNSTGKVEYLEYRGKRAVKVDESNPPSPAQTGEYAGEYESEELGTNYRIASKDGALEIQHQRHGTIPLTRFWRDDFGSHVAFMHSVEFQRDREGRVIGFLINGDPRNRNLRFQKRR